MGLVLVIAVVVAAALAFFWPEGETIGGIEGGAVIAGLSVLIELEFLKGRERLTSYGDVHSVLRY